MLEVTIRRKRDHLCASGEKGKPKAGGMWLNKLQHHSRNRNGGRGETACWRFNLCGIAWYACPSPLGRALGVTGGGVTSNQQQQQHKKKGVSSKCVQGCWAEATETKVEAEAKAEAEAEVEAVGCRSRSSSSSSSSRCRCKCSRTTHNPADLVGQERSAAASPSRVGCLVCVSGQGSGQE